ncbi:cold-shock protein [Parvularcula dongshanensis]|uniref:CspA family cold shock protein n=1 Tax=Parvularcula dongshanensis TaxID=1173995 RepID=A0A840I2Y3_9PROT|nr:cold shock protein [Parvularcula dongshanensis]MBB4658662.1 CspA family cold shock protein [Parvularcula dongshanensis]
MVVTKSAGEAVATDAERLRGRVKWFDPARGFGFAVSEDGGGDVFFGAEALRSYGLETACEGATLVCEAVRRTKGLQAVRILEVDSSTASAESARFVPVGTFRSATVKWFSRVKGYGFLSEGPGTPDIFVHVETVRAAGLGELRTGDRLRVSYGEGPKGRLADAVAKEQDN